MKPTKIDTRCLAITHTPARTSLPSSSTTYQVQIPVMETIAYFNVDILRLVIKQSGNVDFPHTRYLHKLFEATAVRYKSQHPACIFSLVWLKRHFFDMLQKRIGRATFMASDPKQLMTLKRLETLLKVYGELGGPSWTIKAYHM